MCSKQIHVSKKFLMKRKFQIQIDVTVFIKSLSSGNIQSILFRGTNFFLHIYETSTSYFRPSSKWSEWQKE